MRVAPAAVTHGSLMVSISEDPIVSQPAPFSDGQTVVVQHPDGYVTWYGHCSSIKVKRGDWVTKKDVIALVGSTGRSTGPHLHFMVMRHGQMIDPLLFVW